MTSQRLGLHLNVDTRCIISVYCPANLTPRLPGTFMNSSCTFQVPVSNGSVSCGNLRNLHDRRRLCHVKALC